MVLGKEGAVKCGQEEGANALCGFRHQKMECLTQLSSRPFGLAPSYNSPLTLHL
jgi:hypothetical protein